MFNKDFYPTPRNVVEEMIKNEQVTGCVVLEPSAGKGNIIKVLKEYCVSEVLSCEIIEEFQPYLKENSRFLKPDFMDVQPGEVSHVQYIIMNPPFSKAIEHIEHAFNIAPPGCTIISLCNETNIKPETHYWGCKYTDEELDEITRKNKRKQRLIHLVENNGFSESLYDCFTEAERKTDVRVAKVVLFKQGKEDELDFGAYMDFSFDEHSSQAGVMPYNEVRECVNRYIGAVNKYTETMAAIEAMNSLVKPFDAYGNTQITVSIKTERSNLSFGEYKKQLQKAAWQWIFNKLNMEKYQTTKLHEQMDRYIELKCKYPFTVRNIYSVLDMIIQTHGQRMESTLVEAFDLICSYSADNKTQYEGWKTNSAYKVNKRFIVPYMCEGYDRWDKKSKPYVTLSDYHSRELNDIYKALCYMEGIDYNMIMTPAQMMYQNRHYQWGVWYEAGFFRLRGYKKGTMHFEFVSDKVWERFNRRVAEIKGWAIPEKTDNKTKGTERTKPGGVEVYEQQNQNEDPAESDTVVAVVPFVPVPNQPGPAECQTEPAEVVETEFSEVTEPGPMAPEPITQQHAKQNNSFTRSVIWQN